MAETSDDIINRMMYGGLWQGNTNQANNGDGSDVGEYISPTNSLWDSFSGSNIGDTISGLIGNSATPTMGSTGLGGGLGALNLGMDMFNSYDQYKTNKLNRKLGKQRYEANADAIAASQNSRDAFSNAMTNSITSQASRGLGLPSQTKLKLGGF